MKNLKNLTHSSAARQRGVVLFFALVSLVAMSLAAVALIRSVDTATLIAGNLALKQSASDSGDRGIEAASIWLAGIQAANAGLNVLKDPSHPFNVTCLSTRAAATANATDPGCAAIVNGYHSSINPALNLQDEATWTSANSAPAPADNSGYTVRYIIQRVCRQPNLPVETAGCLFGGMAAVDNSGKEIKTPQQICIGPGCPLSGQSPQNRITARAVGPKNTVSYVQAFAF